MLILVDLRFGKGKNSMVNQTWRVYMKHISTLIIAAFISVSCSTTNYKSSELNNMVDSYNEQAKGLIVKNRAKKLNKSAVLNDAKGLIEKAGPILMAYSKKYPQCETFLKGIINSAPKMQKLSLPQIEKMYHEGEALPKSDEICYDAKELIVHPATVVILAKKKRLNKDQRGQITDEIEEVLGHLEMFKEAI